MGGMLRRRRPGGGRHRHDGAQGAASDLGPSSTRWLLARERAAHAEAELQRRALHDLIMQLPAALSIQSGPDHVYELCNPLYRRIVGGRAIEGRAFREAAPDIRTPGLLPMLDHVYATGEPLTAREVSVQIPAGGAGAVEEAFYDGVIQPIRDPSGAVRGVMTCAFDVTAQVLARRRAEQLAAENARLLAVAEEARARAEELSHAKDVFLATVSHELRTPLAAVVGWTRMLRAGAVAPEKRDRALEIIERNADALSELVEELVDSSRIAAGKLILSPVRAPVAPSVEAALEAVRPLAEAKGVLLSASLDRAAVGCIDAGRIQQVVWNLITNAVKFTLAGGAVGVRLSEADGEIAIVVEDSGEGIAAELLPHVFEPFRQGLSDGRPKSGLGLGLAIVQHLVEVHGGSITAESEGPGRGARFTVRLPASPSDAAVDAGR